MTEYRLPTQEDVDAITARLLEHSAAAKVAYNAVLHVSVEMNEGASRIELYELEKQLMADHPGLLFDFRLLKPGAMAAG